MIMLGNCFPSTRIRKYGFSNFEDVYKITCVINETLILTELHGFICNPVNLYNLALLGKHFKF